MRRVALLLGVALLGAGALLISGVGRATQPTLTVFAAASLSEVGPSLESAFEQDHDVDVRISYGGSSLLAVQISLGAPADVILSASEDAVRDLDLKSTATFASNELAIAVAKGNPLAIRSVSELSRLTVAACAPQVPCGAIAESWLRSAGVRPVTLESDVKAVAGKVALGEVDAGVVYRTDVRADRRLEAITITPPLRTTYVAGATSDAGREFVRFMRSDQVATLLAAAGFTSP